jgi:hypothetical protein
LSTISVAARNTCQAGSPHSNGDVIYYDFLNGNPSCSSNTNIVETDAGTTPANPFTMGRDICSTQ